MPHARHSCVASCPPCKEWGEIGKCSPHCEGCSDFDCRRLPQRAQGNPGMKPGAPPGRWCCGSPGLSAAAQASPGDSALCRTWQRGQRSQCSAGLTGRQCAVQDLAEGPWRQSNLDAGASMIISVPAPMGGAIVLGESVIAYMGRGQQMKCTEITPTIIRARGQICNVACSSAPALPSLDNLATCMMLWS